MIRHYDPAPQKVRNDGIVERVSNSEESRLLQARQSSHLRHRIELSPISTSQATWLTSV
jgi:hypothetical protein